MKLVKQLEDDDLYDRPISDGELLQDVCCPECGAVVDESNRCPTCGKRFD